MYDSTNQLLKSNRISGATQYTFNPPNITSNLIYLSSSPNTDTSLTKNIQTINGQYVISASSTLGTNNKLENIFDNDIATFWTTATNSYVKQTPQATGIYIIPSTFSTVITLPAATTIYGEWIQVKFPKRTCVNDIRVLPNGTTTFYDSIKKWYLLGTNNPSGTNWIVVYSDVDKIFTTATEQSLLPTAGTNTIQYLYYRLVVTQVLGVANSAVGTTQNLKILNLRFIINETILYNDAILCIGEPIQTYPRENTVLDVNGGVNVDGRLTATNLVLQNNVATQDSTTSTFIQLVRGNLTDTNRDYKIGNYGGDFKIISSSAGTDIERFLLQSSDGSFIFKSITGTSIATLTNNGNLTTTGTITNNSDSRIKKDIKDIDNNGALRMILAIKPKTYKFIDEEKSKLQNYGFVAQEIKSIIPEATDVCKDFLPNIMKIAICNNNKIYLDLTNYTDIPLNENNRKINIKFKNGSGDNFNITEINSEYFVVNKKTYEKDSNIIKFIDCPNGEVFVYGYEVNDFQILIKDYIYTLNVSATQELHRKIEAQEVRIKELEDKLEQILGNI